MNVEENLDNALEGVMEELKRRERLHREEQYRAWCDEFASVPDNFKLCLKDGMIAHVELQPYRWIQHGLDLIGSRKGTGSIQLSDGIQGADFSAYLPYPVFQMGAEIFLKGMWLYQFEECRKIQDGTYVSLERRRHYLSMLKKLSPKPHDILGIIRDVELIPVYKGDPPIMHFLKIVGGISRRFYHPLADDEKSWADERYPKRFYNDFMKIGAADAFKSYPEHSLVSRLFVETAERIESLWKAGIE